MMAKGPLGVPRPFVDRGFPWRPPTSREVEEIKQYHVNELGFDRATAERHVDEEWLVVLDEFVPDDMGYRGRVAVAFADHVDNFAVYYWPEGEVEILYDQGSAR